MSRSVLLLWLLLSAVLAFAQDIDDMAPGDVPDELSSENLAAKFVTERLNLNGPEIDQLLEMGLITSIQQRALDVHIQHNGPLIDVNELQSIRAFDLETIQHLRPYVKIGAGVSTDASLPRALLKHLTHEYSGRFQSKKNLGTSVQVNKYPGPDFGLRIGYRARSLSKLSLAILMEKDAGERLILKTHPGIEFFSGHIALKGISPVVRKLVLGDFQVRFGQGLLIHHGLAFRSLTTLESGVVKAGFKEKTSWAESGYLRGMAITLQVLARLRLYGFGAFQYRDAHVSLIDGQRIFSAYDFSGAHRTPTQSARRNAVKYRGSGMRVELGAKRLLTGINFVIIVPNAAKVYQLPENYTERREVAGSIDSRITLGNLLLYGELSLRPGKTPAFVAGAIVNNGRRLQGHLRMIRAPSGARTTESNVPGSYFQRSDESSHSAAISIRPAHRWKAVLMSEQWYSRQRRALTTYTFRGSVTGARISYEVRRKLQLYARFRSRRTFSNSVEFVRIDRSVRNSIRVHFSYAPGRQAELRTRLEAIWSTKSGASTRGILFYQHAQLTLRSMPLRFVVRYSLFDVNGYEARIFSFENSAYSRLMLHQAQGTGMRLLTGIRYRINAKLANLSIELHMIYQSQFDNNSELNRTLSYSMQVRVTI